ncbi:MAG: dipeptidyl aminopeptidase/acylaminoacyl peptidase [Cellvibrionaceae bacterium]|jgi:dipeptidyl aminopeptidase/acylaminoacyl peptidase
MTQSDLNDSHSADWKEWFQAPQIAAYSTAKQNPNIGLVASSESGTLQWYVWNPSAQNPANDLRQITHTAGGHSNTLFLSADGRYAYTLDDSKGNEIGHFGRIQLDAPDSFQLEDITPDLPLYSAFGINVSGTAGKIGFVAVFNNIFHLYTLDIAADGTLSNRKELVTSKATIGNVEFSADGQTVFCMTNERSGTPATSLRAYHSTTGELIAELWDGVGTSTRIKTTSPIDGDSWVLATTDRNGAETLVLWNPHSGEREDLLLGENEISGAVFPSDWSSDGKKILFSSMNQAEEKLFTYDIGSKQLVTLNSAPGTYSSAKFAKKLGIEGDDILTLWQDATRPNTLVMLDGDSGEIKNVVMAAGEIPPGRPWRSVSFKSANGQTIQGWLGVPEGEGPFPTILETHGGPTSVKTNSFSAVSQTWMEHGFAFLSINYQGSTTFGREFQESIYGNLGELEVQDMVAAREWLIDNGISHPAKIFPAGGSYGGYLTLMALGVTPDLWAGGLAFVAIADWSIQYEDTAETLRAYQISLFGGTPDEVPEQYAKSSPITYAEDVVAPVIIMQGRNDTRTPARPIVMYEEKLKALGKHIELHWFETGHAGSRTDIKKAIEYMELQLDFVQRILKN